MLDPVKNAKFVAFLLFIIGAVSILAALPEFSDSDPISVFIDIGIGILYIILGVGLRKSKLWGVYGLGILGLIQFGLLAFMLTAGYGLSGGLLLSLIVTIILFAWFLSAKKRFSK